MSAETNHFSRAFRLIWGRLGRARAYVAAAAIAVVALAGVGVWHLISPFKQTQSATADLPIESATPAKKPPPSSSPQTAIARIQPGAQQSLSLAVPTPAAAPAEAEGKVQITKLEQSEKRGPHGETFVVATIGLASRADVENSGGVEIHVYFYDLTPDNEIRPTDAQVTYQWLTPVRDWSDPAPKFLEATYFKRSRGPRSFERLRYGGFVVRVFSGGKLHAEQSHPETLLALFRNNATEQPAPNPSIGPVNRSTQEPASLPLSRRSPAPRDEGGSPGPMSRQGAGEDGAPPPEPPESRRSLGVGGSPPPASAASTTTTSKASPPSAVPSPTPPDLSRRSPAPRDEGGSLPYGKPIPGKPGFLYSPYDEKFIIDVRGFPPGTLVNDPNTNKPFRVP